MCNDSPRRRGKRQQIFKEVMAKNVSDFMKSSTIPKQDKHQKAIPRLIIVKLLRAKTEKMLQVAREK